MTREEYYSALEDRCGRTDWGNPDDIRAYNEYARLLRSNMEWEDRIEMEMEWED